ncbi:MAG: hypothetical protein K6C68_01475, partial [Ruminococcus sp.]|nr:hypothetical protein [Ruminococcus sp.]
SRLHSNQTCKLTNKSSTNTSELVEAKGVRKWGSVRGQKPRGKVLHMRSICGILAIATCPVPLGVCPLTSRLKVTARNKQSVQGHKVKAKATVPSIIICKIDTL